MRDSNPHGQNPAVFKTAALPVRTNPPRVPLLKFGNGNFVKLILIAGLMNFSPKQLLLLPNPCIQGKNHSSSAIGILSHTSEYIIISPLTSVKINIFFLLNKELNKAVFLIAG